MRDKVKGFQKVANRISEIGLNFERLKRTLVLRKVKEKKKKQIF